MQQVNNFINDVFVEAESGRWFDKRSPVDNSVIASISEAGRADVDRAVAAAKAALHGEWGRCRGDGSPGGGRRYAGQYSCQHEREAACR